jgi:hypothetical protein
MLRQLAIDAVKARRRAQRARRNREARAKVLAEMNLKLPVRLENPGGVRSIDDAVATRPTDIHRQRLGNPYHAIGNLTAMLDNNQLDRLIEGPDELIAALPHIGRVHLTPHRWPLEDKGGRAGLAIDG